MQDTDSNRKQIFREKYALSPEILTEVETIADYDKYGVLQWCSVYQLDGEDRFFKFWGEEDCMNYNTVEVFPHTRIITIYDETR